MAIGVQISDQYGDLGPLFPARLGRVVYQREFRYADADAAAARAAGSEFVVSIPQMDATKGFFVAWRNFPDGDNRWWYPSYIDNLSTPHIFRIGNLGYDATWNNNTKTLTPSISPGTYPGGGVPVLTILGFRFG